ncbi:MAG: nucleoside hydrolase [Anaerolineales bacterium]|nr:nucleoside hydrolase [Anaerolineales bacterium]
MTHRRKSLLAGWLAVTLALAACAPAAPPPATPTPFTGAPRAVIVDTDLSSDGLMALLYLFQRPDLLIEAVTVSGTGMVHCAAGVTQVRGLAALVGLPKVPVACGPEEPLGGGHPFPAEWRVAVDAGYGLDLPENPEPVGPSAINLITETLTAAPEPLLVLTLGPLTNLAAALQAQPELAAKISMVYVMGGALTVDGNAGPDSPLAEWNFYADPMAAEVVLASGAPLTLVALDATNTLPVTAAYARRIAQQAVTPEARAVAQILAAEAALIDGGDYYFWDVAAAMLLSEPGLAPARAATVRVETSGAEAGRTLEAPEGAPVLVAGEPEPARFAELFLATLNAP